MHDISYVRGKNSRPIAYAISVEGNIDFFPFFLGCVFYSMHGVCVDVSMWIRDERRHPRLFEMFSHTMYGLFSVAYTICIINHHQQKQKQEQPQQKWKLQQQQQ